jgi:hypothetical protein
VAKTIRSTIRVLDRDQPPRSYRDASGPKLGIVAKPVLTRRRFLQGTGIIFGMLWASSSALIALAPSRAWALELKSLDERTGQALLTLTRHIFPHDKLDDAVYALVVKELDAEAAATPATSDLLGGGVAALDKAAGGNWLGLGRDKQLDLVKSIAGNPFFEKVRGKAVVSLYSNELAFAHFGYEGDAWKHGGGYLTRGFNDLKWLPVPPENASPPPYTG